MNAISPTIYLIDKKVKKPDDVVRDLKKVRTTQDGTNRAWVYYKESNSHAPDWASFVTSNFKIKGTPFLQSSAHALVVLKINGRLLAVPFGMGIHLIDLNKIEYNFGLKVALNTIRKDDLRQIDLTTPEASSQKTRRQAYKGTTPEDFGVHKQKDILRGVVGRLDKKHILGKSVEGKDSLRVRTKVNSLQELNSLCKEALKIAKADTYKKDYEWIDNISIVSDPILNDQLFDGLVSNIIAEKTDNMLISPPDFVEDLYKYDGFIFTGNGKQTSKKAPIDLPDASDFCRDYGTEKLKELTVKKLKESCKVYLKKGDDLEYGWPLSKCISWEYKSNSNNFVLSGGTWYRFEKSFFEEVNLFFNNHINSKCNLPNWDSSKHKKESQFNEYVNKALSEYYLFDLGSSKAKHKHICKDRNEICDLYHAEKKDFIHVKVGKGSQPLGHLFRQVAFSAEVLKRERQEFDKFQNYLKADNCPSKYLDNEFQPSNSAATMAILIKNGQSKDIPFFSKVSFKAMVEGTLSLIGVTPRFVFIQEG